MFYCPLIVYQHIVGVVLKLNVYLLKRLHPKHIKDFASIDRRWLMFSYNFITIYSDVSNQQDYTAVLFRKHRLKDFIIQDFTQASFSTICLETSFVGH